MNKQLTELLTNYGPVGAIWFDGIWDQPTNFNWQLEEQYALIHKLQPSCLIGNNHHRTPYAGEDFQMFERDLPGENKAGFSAGQGISELPLETCETMNGMWGYRIEDQNYKSPKELIHYLVKAAGKNANLQYDAIYIPLKEKVKKAIHFISKTPLSFKQEKDGIFIKLPQVPDDIDYVIELVIKQ